MMKFNRAHQQIGVKRRNHGCNQRNYSEQCYWNAIQSV